MAACGEGGNYHLENLGLKQVLGMEDDTFGFSELRFGMKTFVYEVWTWAAPFMNRSTRGKNLHTGRERILFLLGWLWISRNKKVLGLQMNMRELFGVMKMF